MSITLEEFQKDAAPWLARMKKTGEPLHLVAGPEAFELRPVPAADLATLLPKRDIISGDPEELVHLDWSSEWRP